MGALCKRNPPYHAPSTMTMPILTQGEGWEKVLASFTLCRAQGWDPSRKEEARGRVNLTSEAGAQLSVRPVGRVMASKGGGAEPTIRFF